VDSLSVPQAELVPHHDGYCRELRGGHRRTLAPGQKGKPVPRDRLAWQPVTSDYPPVPGMSRPDRMPLAMPFLAQYDPRNGPMR